jgi:3-hydroxyisobutyrate dehydrogenase-like beta-hydroxyacid dehydrogenase
MTRIAVLGLTDASLPLAVVLQAGGAEVVGYDPAAPQFAPFELADSVENAVHNSDIVLSFGTPQNAVSLATKSAPLLKADALYVDLGPGTPAHKQRLGELFAAGSFVDAALNQDTIEAAGAGAQKLAEILGFTEVNTVVVSDTVGDVAKRVLIRTLLRSGLAEVITDTLWTAESLGIEDWAWADIQKSLTKINADTTQALIDDAAANFKPHQMAMQDVVEILAESGYESTMIAPIQFTHGRLMHGKKIPHSQAPAKKWLR